MTTVAVLSDIHGVRPALEAVLAEPDVVAADRVVLTGDIVSGPQPAQVMERLLGLGDRAVWVRGNADREVVETVDGKHSQHAETVWAARSLSDKHVAVLRGLPHPLTLPVGGFGEVMFCHGSPRDDDEVVLVDTRVSRWREALADVPDDVRTLVGGHTHMPFQRLVEGRLVVNPGSVGMPYGRAGAHWALLDGRAPGGVVQLRVSSYDIPAAVEEVAGCGMPGAREWAEEFLTAANSDVDALTAFGPRDGRAAHG